MTERDPQGFEIIRRRVVYYAEIGIMDAGGRGLWDETKESHPYAHSKDAAHYLNLSGFFVTDPDGFVWKKPSDPWATARIRRAEEPVIKHRIQGADSHTWVKDDFT